MSACTMRLASCPIPRTSRRSPQACIAGRRGSRTVSDLFPFSALPYTPSFLRWRLINFSMSRFKYGLLVFAMIAFASSIVIQKHRLFSGKLFPSINNDVRILRIVLHAESVSAILLRCHDRCAGPSEQVKHILARLTGALHKEEKNEISGCGLTGSTFR